jgi:hypothetical protein
VAARKQVRALRSGYKHHYRIKSAKPCTPEFRLRQTETERRVRMKKMEEINESSVRQKSAKLLKNRKRSLDLITLRIHHGTYQNPNLEPLNRSNGSDNRSVSIIRRRRVQKNNFWRTFSKDQKAAKFVGIIMGVFVVCWLPYFVYLTLSGVFIVRLKDELNHELLFKIFSWLGYTNSALDVLVYVSTSKELRTTLFKLFIQRRSRNTRN